MTTSAGQITKLVTYGILVALAIWLLTLISSTVTILLISFLIAYILDPLASYLESRWMNRMTATVVIFLFIAMILIVIFAFIVPPIITEIQVINSTISSDTSVAAFDRIESMVKQYLPFIDTSNLDIHGWISGLLSNAFSSIFSVIGSVVAVLTTLVIIPFAVFFLLKDGRRMKKTFVGLVPNQYFEMTLNILYKIDLQLGGYLRGQFLDAVTVGVLSVIGLWLLGVPYFFLIGIFAGLSNMIPYVGPLVGGATAVLVVLFNSGDGQQALLVIALFVVIQLLDNVLIQPLVVARSVNLHPLIIIFVVIIGGQFFGILGMLLAVPAAGVIKVLIQEFYTVFREYHVI